MPTMILPFWWAHQYIAQTNQPVSQSLSGRLPFWNVGPQGTTFGTEPNYPCCAVRFPHRPPQIHLPLLALLRHQQQHHPHAPRPLRTPHDPLPPQQKSTSHARPTTPFSHLLTYTITAQHPFLLSIRVPSWADLPTSGIETTYLSAQPLHHDPHTGLHHTPIASGHTRVEIWFGASIRIHPHPTSTGDNSTISIHHGALAYALSPSASYFSSPIKYTTHPRALDWTIYPSSTWNMAIDPTSLVFYEYSNRYKQLPNPIWG